MVFKSFVVGHLHSLHDFDDDGGEPIAVKVDFLVVGDLADVARTGRSVSMWFLTCHLVVFCSFLFCI